MCWVTNVLGHKTESNDKDTMCVDVFDRIPKYIESQEIISGIWPIFKVPVVGLFSTPVKWIYTGQFSFTYT